MSNYIDHKERRSSSIEMSAALPALVRVGRWNFVRAQVLQDAAQELLELPHFAFAESRLQDRHRLCMPCAKQRIECTSLAREPNSLGAPIVGTLPALNQAKLLHSPDQTEQRAFRHPQSAAEFCHDAPAILAKRKKDAPHPYRDLFGQVRLGIQPLEQRLKTKCEGDDEKRQIGKM